MKEKIKAVGEIIKQSLNILWKYKSLTLAGMFSALVLYQNLLDIIQNSLGLFKYLSSLSKAFSETSNFVTSVIQNSKIVLNNDPKFFFKAASITFSVLLLAIIIVWFAIVLKTAILSNLCQIASNQLFSWKTAIKKGVALFWKALFLGMISWIIYFAIFFVLMLPLNLTQISWFVLWYSTLAMSASLVIYTIIKLLQIFVLQFLIGGQSIYGSIKSSLALLANHKLSIGIILIMMSLLKIITFYGLEFLYAKIMPQTIALGKIINLISFSSINNVVSYLTFFLNILIMLLFIGLVSVFELAVWTIWFKKNQQQF